MKTYWNYSIFIDGRCVCSAGEETLPAAITAGISSMIYYKAVNPDAKISMGGLLEACSRCHNAREVTIVGPRSRKTVRCPECKGKGALGHMVDIPLVMPDPANRISLVQS